ncbi:hypothetical protein TSUD_186790 [Trifolium subterraneum]|uniref:Reverse transcriptase domain-containing protein n=1 Tax=Trifolium subterraneum TaxID=3900 RepID=A0A2Z6P9D4_TRISU|nr:hypothetical protein TSUD_186790 [Trifolium subterraneum]
MAENNFESLNLDEEEELNFVVGEDTDEQHDLNLCLVGRFVHDRPIRFNSMKACLADVWRPVKGMTVKEATQGLYLFKFFHPLDVEEVLKGGPWTFDSFTLIIDRLKIGVALQDIPLFHVNFWVQIHDVPIGMMLETVGKSLANYIGEFVEYDKNNNTSFWRKYMRVKVRVDVRSPLKIEKKIKLNGENKCEVKYVMERDDGRRSWSNEIRAEIRRPGGRVAIDVEGRSEGLAVFWKDSSKCRVLNYTCNFINMIVEDEQWGEWRLTCYYGYPERSRRCAAWDLLRDLGNMSSIPWCIIGDFNDLLSQADKKGIHPHPNGLCMGFRQTVSDCDLTDIPIEGHLFTWIKSRGTPHVIEERLDRAMASASWLQLFPQINNSFRFENSWLKEPDLEDVVVEGWGGRENLEVVDRVTRCANKLQRWGKKKRVRFKEEIDECVRRMNELRATARSKKKKVTKLIADNGTESLTQEELCEVAKSYFDTLFKPRDRDYDLVLDLIQSRVTDDDNLFLTAPITKVEIQQALFQMHPDKSPGPDGFNPAFYQRFWEQCSEDIFSAASNWIERGYFPTSLNETNIYLIPKCDNPTSMKDLRPISLCNVLYKMISKVLANRGYPHALKRKTQGRRGELALKIDISKAYDKVDWGFLRGVMTKMGFTDVWIRWVMMCVSLVNYSVLMNYDRVGPIFPGRGLRQGDPLSPYLFILVTECLTALIHRAVGRGDLHGVRICRGAPEVSHLLFADDCFLFCRANVAEVNELMRILHTYEQALEERRKSKREGGELGQGISWRFKSQDPRIVELRSRIGSGDNIRVMHDPWLQGSADRWVPSPQPASVYQLSVRDLLHDNYKAWNIAKVRNLFSGDVAKRILETPFVRSVREDKVVWDEERNECYSVKSGYKLAMRYIIGSDKYHVAGNWNGIWKAQAPHKARHLLWRLCRGCLPTRYRLLERRVECNLNCPVCDEEIEDELHIFFRFISLPRVFQRGVNQKQTSKEYGEDETKRNGEGEFWFESKRRRRNRIETAMANTEKTKTKSKTKPKTKAKTKAKTTKDAKVNATSTKNEQPVGEESFSNIFSVVFNHGGEFCKENNKKIYIGDGQLYVEHKDDESDGSGFIEYESDEVEGLDDSEDERAAGLDDGFVKNPHDEKTEKTFEENMKMVVSSIGCGDTKFENDEYESEELGSSHPDASDDESGPKGLVAVFEEMFERVEHRLCLRHLYANFKKRFGGGTLIRDLMMGAAKATYYQAWEAKMTARDKPILTICEWIRNYLMNRSSASVSKLTNWPHRILPMPQRRLEKEVSMTGYWQPTWVIHEEFQVAHEFNGQQFIVNTAKKTCTCNFWELVDLFGDIPDEVMASIPYVKAIEKKLPVKTKKRKGDHHQPLYHGMKTRKSERIKMNSFKTPVTGVGSSKTQPIVINETDGKNMSNKK